MSPGSGRAAVSSRLCGDTFLTRTLLQPLMGASDSDVGPDRGVCGYWVGVIGCTGSSSVSVLGVG